MIRPLAYRSRRETRMKSGRNTWIKRKKLTRCSSFVWFRRAMQKTTRTFSDRASGDGSPAEPLVRGGLRAARSLVAPGGVSIALAFGLSTSAPVGLAGIIGLIGIESGRGPPH
jgi:hypothetical protein